MNSCWQRLSGKLLTLPSTSYHEERSMFQKEEAEILNYFTWAAFPRTETGTRSAHLSCKCPLVWSPFVGIASSFTFRSLDLRYWQKPSQFRNLSPILTSLIFLLHSILGYILTASHLGLCFSFTKSVEVWVRDSLCPKISHQDLLWFSHVCTYVCIHVYLITHARCLFLCTKIDTGSPLCSTSLTSWCVLLMLLSGLYQKLLGSQL